MDKMGEYKEINKYEQWVDIFKGFLIIFVVVGHGYYQKLNGIIFWFHMPLFFWTSGYLLKTPGRKNITAWCKKQVRSLLAPCMSFYLLNMLLLIEKPNLSEGFKKILIFLYGGRMLPGVYWFITCLLLSRIIMVFIESYIGSKKRKMAIYIIMYVLAVVESKTIIPSGIYYYPNVPLYCLVPWNADVCLFAIPFMAVGKYSKEMALILKEHFEDSIRTKETILLCLAAAIFAIFGLFQICGVYSVDINMKYVHYSNYVLCILLPLSVGVILMKCSMALSNGGVRCNNIV